MKAADFKFFSSYVKLTGKSGRSAAWLAHLTGGQGVAGSNPVAPIFLPAGKKIEQVNLEQVNSRANAAGTKERLSPEQNAPPAVTCSPDQLFPAQPPPAVA